MSTVGAVRAVLVLAAGVAGLLLPAGPAEAVRVPVTQDHRLPVGAAPVEPGFPIDHVAVYWLTHRHEAHDGHGAAAVRLRHDGVWGPWIALVKDGASAPGLWNSALVAGGDADAYQVRGVPVEAVRPRAVALNTTDGPRRTLRWRRSGTAVAFADCVSRADWGADESLRSSKRSYAPVQVMTVHHTVTRNDDPDPAATVRAIYAYHTRHLGWDDIGYHYLIDERGRLYEGRWSGSDSASCVTAGGDGRQFAHNDAGEAVTGAHTGGYNTGNLGLAVLGDLRTVPPEAAAVTALADALAELATRHGLDPEGTVAYDNGTNRAHAPAVSGHRDFNATECPGDRLYDRLPAIRRDVATRMAAPADRPPTVAITRPADPAIVWGDTSVSADASDDRGVTAVEFLVDGSRIGLDGDGSDGWSTAWDTSTVPAGPHEVTAVAADTAGQTATASVTVSVVSGTVPTPPLPELARRFLVGRGSAS